MSSRGSLWNKWDLQVHTLGTAKNGQFTSTSFEEFCVVFFNKALEKQIAVIGITDYFNIDNYKKVVEFVKNIDSFNKTSDEGVPLFTHEEKEKIKEIYLLPNVELRMMPATDSGRLVNIHCLFNPKFVPSIENDFFGSIEYSARSGRKYKMNHQGLTDLGKSLDQNLNDDAAYKKGLNTFVVSHSDLQRLHDENANFRENVIIAVSNSSNDGASAFQQHYDLFENDVQSQLDAVRKSIYCISHAIFSSNVEDRKYFLGEKIDNEQTVISKCGSLKPCIHGSDAHTEDKLFNPDNNMYCWIKADLTFEGLKQILWEPKDRVKIQERNPSDAKSGRIIIDRLSYKDPSGNENEILLNKDLNSIIGVRGSGKSTLLKNIAYTADPNQFAARGDNASRLYPLDSFKIIWGDGQENGGTDESPKSVFYIPQNYLSLLAYDETGKAEARDEFLTQLLKKNVKFANAIRSYDDFVSDNKVKIEGLIENLLKQNVILAEARIQIRKQGSRKEIEEEIKTKNEDIKKYKGTDGQALTEEEVKSYTQARQAVMDSNKVTTILGQDKTILSGLLESGADVYIANQEIARLSSQRQLTLRTELLKKSKESLSELIKSEIGKIDAEIQALNKTVTDNQQILDKFGDRIKANKVLETLTKELSQLQQTLKTIDELEKTISQATTSKEEAITGLVGSYTAFDAQQDAIFRTVEFTEDFKFLKIDVGTYYNTSDLKEFVLRNINTRDTDPNLKLDSDITILFSESPVKLSPEVVRKIIENLVNGKIVIKKEAVDVPQVVSQLLKDRYEVDFLNSVKTKEEEVLFKNMTGGQKAIAMLELVFSFDDEHYPILIDQPEDDLDVSGVATDLVNFIKVHKENRQIIVVSHNGSLVVCADTEEVLVSECKKTTGNKLDFSYNTGAIENPEIREQIIKVLEGGREALKQRARKLNFKHEI